MLARTCNESDQLYTTKNRQQQVKVKLWILLLNNKHINFSRYQVRPQSAFKFTGCFSTNKSSNPSHPMIPDVPAHSNWLCPESELCTSLGTDDVLSGWGVQLYRVAKIILGYLSCFLLIPEVRKSRASHWSLKGTSTMPLHVLHL